MKVYKNGDVLIGTLASDASDDAGNDPGDLVTLNANALVVAAVGDKLTFKAPANTDNYNTTHFLSGLTPTNDRANKVDTFTLYNGFPDRPHTELKSFTIYSKSNDDYIVPSGSSVYQINRLGGVGNTCQLTDMPRITSHNLLIY